MSVPANLTGRPLTDADYAALEARWISREVADAALLRRVVSIEGAELVGRQGKQGDYSGIVISYVWPGEDHVRGVRIRRDHPDFEVVTGGGLRQARKYVGEPGRTNSLYLPPDLEPPLLDNAAIPAIITEGEFKSLALWRLAWHGLGDAADAPMFVPVGLQGVYSWRGVVGKTSDADGERVDVKGAVPDLSRVAWNGRRVVILFDMNIESNIGVGQARRDLTRELEGRGAEVSWWKWPGDLPATINGIDDFLAARGPDEAVRCLGKARKVTRKRKAPATAGEAIAADDWRAGLIRTETGGIKAVLANVLTALRLAPELQGMLAWDEFASRTMALQGTPWNAQSREWEETDDTLLCEWLQHRGLHVTTLAVTQAVEAVARERGYHPVREYLSGLTWDKVPRLDRWLPEYFGAEDTLYSRAVGSRWLISAVARVMEPGCQADHCLILQGEQGIRKSSALRIMGGEWFTDRVGDLNDKDAAIQLMGRWLIEFAELDDVISVRAEMGTVKAFITRRVDRFRPPFGRRAADYQRQCVFAGSVNLDTFLRDETGGRRFWPVTCQAINLPALERDRDQIWAEARARYEAREPWWLSEPELVQQAAEQTDMRHESDPWDEIVWQFVLGARQAWMDGDHPGDAFSITTIEVLKGAIGKKIDAWTGPDKYRVQRILRRHGLRSARERVFDDSSSEPKVGPNGLQERRYCYRWPG